MLTKLALTVTLGLVSGCALTSKGEALQPRFFTAEAAGAEVAGAEGRATSPKVAAGGAACGARLGRVDAAGHLRERMVYREASGEVGIYEELRWTERPEDYVRRAVEHALFEEQGVQEVVTGDAPALELEVLAFEEVRNAGGRRGRLRIAAELQDDRTVKWRETFTVERPVVTKDAKEVPSQLAAALSQALSEVSRAVAERATRELGCTVTERPKTASGT